MRRLSLFRLHFRIFNSDRRQTPSEGRRLSRRFLSLADKAVLTSGIPLSQSGSNRPQPAGKVHISQEIHSRFPVYVAGQPGFPGEFPGRAAKFPAKSTGGFRGCHFPRNSPWGVAAHPGNFRKSWLPGNPRGITRGNHFRRTTLPALPSGQRRRSAAHR